MTAKLYYEAHVTIDPVFDAQRELAAFLAKDWQFRLAKLYMDKGVPNQKDTFMTGHGMELNDIKMRTINLVGSLKRHGFNVRRYKIEDTILDSRTNDELRLL